MISAVNGLPIESQPLIVGRPSAQICLSAFLIKVASSEPDLRKLGVEVVTDTFAAAFATHSGMIRTAERGFRCRQREAVDADHARLQLRHRPARALRCRSEGIGRQSHWRS